MNRSRISRFPVRTAIGVLAAAALAAPSAAQQTGYQQPPQQIVDILDAPPLPGVSVSPDRAWLLFSDRTSMPGIAELAEPRLHLAGTRINPRTNGPAGVPRVIGLRLKNIESGAEHAIGTPADASILRTYWSPDARRIAFLESGDDGIHLWVADAAMGETRQVTDARVNAIGFNACQWMPDGRHMLCEFVPDGRGEQPEQPAVPSGPVIQESSGEVSPVRTYQDLLEDTHDEALFDHYFTSQLAIVDMDSGQRTPIGRPAIFRGVDPAPGGEHLLVTRITRPYSYLVPAGLFPHEVEVWDLQGRVVHRVAQVPMLDNLRPNHVPTGPRNVSWRPLVPATLVWAEALDEGDPGREVEYRDRVLMLAAPFTAEPTELARTQERYSGIQWGEQGFALLSDYRRSERQRRTWIFDPDAPAEKRLLWDRNVEDAYNDPGNPVYRPTDAGNAVIERNGDWIYLSGSGASEQGDRPFLDRLNLRTLRTERLWRSEPEAYETFVALLDDQARRVITRRETIDEPPNYFLRDVRRDRSTALTDFPDPAPQLRGIRKELVVYAREDGVPLNGTLYLPADYTEGVRLPTVVWAYPREFSNADVAGQVRGTSNRFTTIGGSSHLFFLTQGYAVFDGPSMPIVGGDTANNTYVEQLVSSAEAAIDKVVEMGVADRDRIGVGGHSYGAFMTANLLAHSDVFRAGIARSGAYNRTLTPFGFQNEQRTFWEAPEIYARMSPFFHAEKVDEPLLLIHGMADNNSGTFPIQSERMYHAVKGHGGTVRLVMLPLESHGYAARESVLHALHEMMSWFDLHVKNAPPRQRATSQS